MLFATPIGIAIAFTFQFCRRYAGRTDLIKPEDVSQLPEPVQTRAVDNSNWVEAPEVRRARIRGEAEALDPRGATVSAKELNRKKRGAKVAFGPGKQINGNTRASESAFIPLSVQEKQGKAYRKKQAVLAGVDAGSATAERKYLTEPKTEYRTPSDTAPIGDIGEDERVKAKRLKGERGFFDFLKRKK